MTSDSSPNVYQDQKWIVAPIENAVFPPRCVKSNAQLPTADYVLDCDLHRIQLRKPRSADYIVAETMAKLALGSAGATILAMTVKRRLRFLIGLNPQRALKMRRMFVIGLALLILCPLISFVHLYVSGVFHETFHRREMNYVDVSILVMSMLSAVVGLVLVIASYMSVLRIAFSDGTYVWMEGACNEFLKSLPESPVRDRPRLP